MTASPAVGAALQGFEESRPFLPGAWLQDQREQAIADFAAAGFPSRRMEAWKYTSLSGLDRMDFVLPAAPAVTPADWKACVIEGAHRIVISNGRFDSAASRLPGRGSGIVMEALSEAVEHSRDLVHGLMRPDGSALGSLNMAFMQDGLVLHVPDGMETDAPVQVIHLATEAGRRVAIHPRTLVSLGKGSRATVVETFVGTEGARSWTNSVTDVRMDNGSCLLHARLQAEAPTASHTSMTRVEAGREARYASYAVGLGASVSRNEIEVVCTGIGAVCELRGGLLLRGRQHGDNTTRIDHGVPGTRSQQVFRNVLDDASRSVFQGRIEVRPDAQKTDAGQSCRSLLMSEAARADTKPELRILADDVKCAHGATVGDLDQDALFYLQSRGIPGDEARALLIEAFVAEVIEDVPDSTVRDYLAAAVSGWAAGVIRT